MLGRIRITAAFTLSFFLIYSLSTRAQQCPPCYNNQEPPIRYNEFSGSIRSRLSIAISEDIVYTQPGQSDRLVQAVDSAANMWNTATNPSVPSSSYAYHAQYIFSRTLESQRPDFIIEVGSPASGCAEIDTSVYPHIITIAHSLLNLSVEDLAATIAHELGHRIGLANADSNCAGQDTIMAGSEFPSCAPVAAARRVTPNDVAQSNRNWHHESRDTCTATDQGTAPIDSGPVAGGGAGGRYHEPQPFYYYPETCYQDYDCYDYYTCADSDRGPGEGPKCQYQGTDCYARGEPQCY